jgi:hypothetical protein
MVTGRDVSLEVVRISDVVVVRGVICGLIAEEITK